MDDAQRGAQLELPYRPRTSPAWPPFVLAAPAFDAYRGRELIPGSQLQNEDEIRAFIRKHAETIYHPAGTCRMGTDALAVVDPELCVRGIEGLRVVDASVMPTLIGGNTHAPVIMIAEKASDLVRAAQRKMGSKRSAAILSAPSRCAF